jgi:hypothetical protein
MRRRQKTCCVRLNLEGGMKQKQSNIRTKQNSRIKGTAIIYRTHRDELDINSADFRVDIGAATHPKQFRAYRLRRQKAGKPLPVISADALHRDIMLIVGAGACPNFVISWLYRIITEIKNNKLVIGIKPTGKVATERFDPKKKIHRRPPPNERPYVRQL